ncbi:glycosyl hydrolase family 28 protein [Paenibacillus sp. YIM B09110]|uniref:glycosyl hydrolase family 28 protein n=1 Tax=Paenibacillus sp. YIM B09110 TaxID=3126102 RepID=UPI00301D5185
MCKTTIAYPKPAYTTTSSEFCLNVDDALIPVEKFLDYHYAHFSYSGTSLLTVRASEPITSYDISPHSLGISGKAAGNQLTFSIDSNAEMPNYLVIQINSLEKLVVLADPFEIDAPSSTGTDIYNITDSPYLADNTWTNDVTGIIQQAIDDASSTGGGVVYVPAGVYKVKDIVYMRSNVNLYLQGGAVIKSNPDRTLYDYTTSSEGKVFIDPMIRIDHAPNASITGRGTLDASGIAIMDKDRESSTYLGFRRNVIVGNFSNDVTIEGIIIKDSTTWTINGIQGGDGFTVRNVKIMNHKNADQYKIMNDGIDICGTRNALAEKNFVMTVDDALCAKSTIVDFAMYNIRFNNNIVFSSCAGLKAGLQSLSPMYDVWFENNDVVQARRGIVAEASSGDQLMNNIHFVNTRVESYVFTSMGKSIPVEIDARSAPITHVYIDNALFENPAYNQIHIYGSSDSNAVSNVVFAEVDLCGDMLTNDWDGKIIEGSYVSGITVKADQSE